MTQSIPGLRNAASQYIDMPHWTTMNSSSLIQHILVLRHYPQQHQHLLCVLIDSHGDVESLQLFLEHLQVWVYEAQFQAHLLPDFVVGGHSEKREKLSDKHPRSQVAVTLPIPCRWMTQVLRCLSCWVHASEGTWITVNNNELSNMTPQISVKKEVALITRVQSQPSSAIPSYPWIQFLVQTNK